jgi:arylsulfatase A-like enzyme
MGENRPNLFIIHTDEQSWWTLGCYGGRMGATPNLDRLAANGAVFHNVFTNSAVCTPSRGCLVTGRYPESHGAYTNNVPLNRDEITFAEVLKRHGYRTGYAGKWHLDGTPRPGWVHPARTMGFEHADAMFNRGHWKKIADSPMRDVQPTVHPYDVVGDAGSYTTDWLTDKALDFIEAADDAVGGDRPFCFMLSLPDPHPPVVVRPPYDTCFDPAAVPLPPTVAVESLPDWAQALQARSPFGIDKPDREARLRRFLALYFGEVKLIDDSVGRIVDALEARGDLENTILVFTTDHGEYAGEHGLHGKNHLYETAYRIPFIVHWPRGIAPGTAVQRILSTVDVQPTLLSLMGVPLCGREQGRDGSDLLRGGNPDWDDRAFIHHSTHRRAGIFTPDFELALVKDGESVLFDRVNDPDQMRNLFDDPAYRETVAALTRRVVDHHVALGTPAVPWLIERERALFSQV